MIANSQAEVERKVIEKIGKVQSGELSIFKAFEDPAEELMVTIGKHTLLLNPFYERWLYYDYIHDAWEDMGLKMGEGLIVAYEDTLGVKKLPPALTGEEPLDSWYIYLHDEALGGPLKISELQELLQSKILPAETLVFSAGMTQWQKADSTGLVNGDVARGTDSVSLVPPPPPPAPKPASPFEEAGARYAELKAELNRGAISREWFLRQVNELRFQDSSGTWWQITEDGQGWLKWDGGQWVAFS
jgi:hypothetical protein